MNEMQIFNYNGAEVRTIQHNSEAWWVLRDVCGILDLSSPHKVAERLDDDEKGRSLIPTLGGDQELTIINECGLYNVILRSDKPEAKQFKRWITHEVLPSIRKHGGYLTAEKIEEVLLNPDTIIKLAQNLKTEQAKVVQLKAQIETERPKVIFADAVTSSQTSILVAELAKILKQNGIEIGGKRMFQFLRDEGFLIKRQGTEYNMPTQYAMERGLFEIKETAITHSDGHITVSKTPKVTGKGQSYFINMFLERKAA